VTGFLSRLGHTVRDDRQIDADALAHRINALGRFLQAADGHLPDSRLGAARTVVERAGVRLALSGDHTVVALAGATGSGKSSIFNALARMGLSPVGVRRPTTGVAHSCVWGADDGAVELLDWIGVLPRHRFVRESALDGEDEAMLHGLVLLDLPDFDSVEETHRLEVDRLLGLVDLVIWVVDPQKYADRVVHRGYLREFHRHHDVTVVVLNQADRLPPADVSRVLADLRRLLDADQLGEVPVLATSALEPAAVADLRTLLEQAVTERKAALRRLTGDVDAVTDNLTALVGPVARAGDAIGRSTERQLTDALAASAGVPVVAGAVEAAYRHRAGAATGWPLMRGWHRLRADPLRRLHVPGSAAGRITGAGSGPNPPPLPATSIPTATVAQHAAVGLAVRGLAERASSRLPAPWPAAVIAAARSLAGDLPDALDRAIAGTELGPAVRPLWWRVVGGLQWLVTFAATGGLGWLVVGFAVRALGLPHLEYPMVGVVPLPTLLLVGGLLLGLLITAMVRPLIGWAARHARRRAEDRLRDAVGEVARGQVIAPVRAVLESYTQARDALGAARSTG